MIGGRGAVLARAAGLAAVVAHAGLLGALGALGGSERALVLVGALVAWQVAETAAAAPRIETADLSARAIGWTTLGIVGAALTLPAERFGGAVTLLGEAGLPFGGPAGTSPSWSAPRLEVGLGSLAVGVGLRVWAIRTLGPAFLDGLALLPRHRRVVAGPYRLLHHPADLGLLVALVGAALTTGSLVALGGVAFGLAPLLWWRTRAEDRLLARSLADRPGVGEAAGRRTP